MTGWNRAGYRSKHMWPPKDQPFSTPEPVQGVGVEIEDSKGERTGSVSLNEADSGYSTGDTGC